MRSKTSVQANKVLDAAARLFGSQRFHEVRMDDIATEAAVGKGTLYRYFSDKEELYLALLARSSQQLVDRLQTVAAETASPRCRLAAVVAAIIDFFDEQPHLLDLIQRSEVLRGPDFPWRKTRDKAFQLVLDLFEEGQRRGEFAIADRELAVCMLLGGLRSIIRFGKRPRPPDLPHQIVMTFLHGATRQPC